MKQGRVFLIGAGPGDKGLLTCKGLELIKAADVVVYDRLVSKDIMELIPRTAELINVGKNIGDHPVPQSRINEILLEEALKGKDVVRLKGGDPFVFGRGGEELELLVENGIEFQVVPGITSSISAPAYGGIPVTHRDFCGSLHIITGHGKNDSKADIPFESLVKLNGTLIFMMSVSTSGDIADGLIGAGMEENMPCAIIENGTRSQQRTIVTDLKNLRQTVLDKNVKSPAVIMVGKVCSLSEKFNWFDKLPLKHKKILVTQPQARASSLADKIRGLGGEVRLYPTIETEFIRPINPEFKDYDVLGFTSVEGVRSFMEHLFELGLDARAIYDKKLAVVGSQTAKSLMTYGLKADFIPSSVYDGETMAKEMISTGFLKSDDKILLLRAAEPSMDIIKILEDNSFKVTDYSVYKTRFIRNNNVGDIESFDFVTFTSKSCISGFLATQERKTFEGINALCIGNQTGNEAKKHGFNVLVSNKATVDSMVEKMIEQNK